MLRANFLPPGDDGTIARSWMPQVDEKDLLDLLVFMGKNGVQFSAGVIDPRTVRSHQMVSREAAMGLPDEVLRKPVLISSEPIVIDGDHRWYRHLRDRTQMSFIKFSLPFDVALRTIFRFPKTYRSDDQDRRIA